LCPKLWYSEDKQALFTANKVATIHITITLLNSRYRPGQGQPQSNTLHINQKSTKTIYKAKLKRLKQPSHRSYSIPLNEKKKSTKKEKAQERKIQIQHEEKKQTVVTSSRNFLIVDATHTAKNK
jgi:hypothetical protein